MDVDAMTLKCLVLKAKDERGSSMRQLALAAQGRGFKIVDTTLNAIAAGTYKSRPSADTIRAIAWLAGVSTDVAFTAAGQQPPGPPFADELPPDVDRLSPKHRRLVIELLRVLINHDLQEQGHGQDKAPIDDAGGTPADELDEKRREQESVTRAVGTAARKGKRDKPGTDQSTD